MPVRSPHNPASIPLVCVVLLLSMLAGCTRQPSRKTEDSDHPRRIVSLAPSVTEMLYAIGAGELLVGRTSACDWPEEAKKVPVIGSFGHPSLEVLAAAQPDLVIDVDLADEQIGRKIAAMNIRREPIQCRRPEDVPPALRKLGVLTGHTRQADSLAGVIEKGLASFRKEAELRTNKTGIYLEIWNDPLWTGGRHSFTSSMIAYAGGRNIGDAVDKEYFEISPEWVIRQNPDVIACMYMSKKSPASEIVGSRPGWSGINAVKYGRVYGDFDNNIYLRPGPRVLEGIASLKSLLESPVPVSR
ncbi:MAG: cobalamin-binding protein [Chlorobiaceae bacterium]|nr:cobalamin-binding protein [Chlorobiaceae bacterium]